MKDVGFSETGGAIGETLLVDQEREGDAGFFPEKACVGAVAQPMTSRFCYRDGATSGR
jgi:hypothetical protein